MIELDKYEQQIILACKSWGEWAKRENRYKAVRIVISQYYAIDEEELGLYSVYHCLLELFIKVNQHKQSVLQDFMENIFRESTYGGYKREINMEHIINNLISSISNIAVKNHDGSNIFNELEKNYDILNYGIVIEKSDNIK